MTHKFLFFDLETYLLGDRLCPRTVSAASLYHETDGQYNTVSTSQVNISTRDSNDDYIFDLIETLCLPQDAGAVYYVGHNVSYDFVCLMRDFPQVIPNVFELYSQNRVLDTQIIGKLEAIVAGDLDIRKFSLAALCRRHLDVSLSGKKGEDVWRTKYSQLDGVPLEDWPKDAIDYARDDVIYTKELFINLMQKYGDSEGFDLHSISMQTRADFALHLLSVYGMQVNRSQANKFIDQVNEQCEKNKQMAIDLGILRTNGTKNLKELRKLIAEGYAGVPPLTDKGSVKTDIETMKNSNDPRLKAYAEGRFSDKLQNTYVPILKNNTVHPRYNVLVKSGRTSCRNPNMQNPPRQGGFRSCFKPRDGFVYALCDYDQIELLALGQVHIWLFGDSKIAEAVNAGRDLHCELAAKFKNMHYNAFFQQYKIGYDWAKSLRQFSKVANYGFPGGLSSKVFMKYAKGYGLDVDLEECVKIRNAWLETWPRMDDYFQMIGRAVSWQTAQVSQLSPQNKRVRGKCGFTQYANTLFQGLVADGAKEALFKVSRACYTGEEYPELEYSRPVAFLHDEIILESPEDRAHDAAEALSKCMIETMSRYIPDITVSAESYLSRVWSKDAGRVELDGKLIPWETK